MIWLYNKQNRQLSSATLLTKPEYYNNYATTALRSRMYAKKNTKSTSVFGDGRISTHADLHRHAARVARALTELYK